MPTELILQQAPARAELLESRRELAALRAALAERTLELAHLSAQLKSFEGRYLREVGVLYAELDDLEARIAEREIDLYDSEDARRRAEEARQRARETHEAAFAAAHDADEFDPPPDLKRLFREVAKRIHPDFARDEDEAAHFTLLMSRANEAYSRGDTSTLERILDDQLETAQLAQDEGPFAELARIDRQAAHARRDMARIDDEIHLLSSSEIAQLLADADAAHIDGRDLLAELAASLRERVADAERRFALIDRQIAAHGR